MPEKGLTSRFISPPFKGDLENASRKLERKAITFFKLHTTVLIHLDKHF